MSGREIDSPAVLRRLLAATSSRGRSLERGSRLVQPQQELFDLVSGALDGGLLRLDEEADLLEHAAGGRMIHGHTGKERPLVHLGEELSQRGGRDPLSPVLPPVPVRDLAQTLANEAADVPNHGALALDGAENPERIRENPRPVGVELGAVAGCERARAKSDRITLVVEERVEIQGRNGSQSNTGHGASGS